MRTHYQPYFSGYLYGSRLKFDPVSLRNQRFDHPPKKIVPAKASAIFDNRLYLCLGFPTFVYRTSRLVRRFNGSRATQIKDRAK